MKAEYIKHCLCIFSLASLVIAPITAQADNNGSTKKVEVDLLDLSLEQLMNLTVTAASKNTEQILDASTTAYVITAKEIERFGWRTLADILHAIPNVDLSNNYHSTSVNQRGFSGDGKQSLILINGVENNEVFDFNSQLRGWTGANEIERVEVLMGPNSTLYGTSALLGVINIITKSKGARVTGSNVMISYDEANNTTIEASAIKVGNNHRFGFTMSAQRAENDWQKVKTFASDDALFSRTKTTDPYRDHDPANVRLLDETFSLDSFLEINDFYAGFRFSSQSGTQGLERTRYQWGENTGELRRHSFFVGHSLQGEAWDWDNRLSLRRTNRDYTFTRRNNIDVDDSFSLDFSNIWGVDLSDFPEATEFSDLTTLLSGAYSDEGTEVAWQSVLNYQLSHNGQLKVGLDIKQNEYQSAFSQENRSRPSLSAFNHRPDGTMNSAFTQVTYHLMPKKLTVVGGLRLTQDEHPYAKETSFLSPRLSLIYHPNDGSSLRFTYNEGFRQEYRQDFNIDPEYMKMYEVQYSMQRPLQGEGSYYLSITPYLMQSQGLIREIINPDQNAQQRVIISNGSDYSVSGIEGLFRLHRGALTGMIGGRWLHSGEVEVKLLQDDQQKILNNVPEYKFQIGVAYELPQATTSLFLDYWGKTQTETVLADHQTFIVDGVERPKKEVLEIDNMVLLNLFVSSKKFAVDDAYYRVFAEVSNLLDKANYHANSNPSPVQFLQPERTIRIGFEMAY